MSLDINQDNSSTENTGGGLEEVLISEHKSQSSTKRLATLSLEQRERLQYIEETAIIKFSGELDELESAIGMLRVGHHFGWKVLYLVHSKKTIRKYEEILDIKIRDEFPPEGPSSTRSIGLAISKKFSNFWKIISGEIKFNDEDKESRRKIKEG